MIKLGERIKVRVVTGSLGRVEKPCCCVAIEAFQVIGRGGLGAWGRGGAPGEVTRFLAK